MMYAACIGPYATDEHCTDEVDDSNSGVYSTLRPFSTYHNYNVLVLLSAVITLNQILI